LGNSHRATKTVVRWTGASERTVKHWLAGRHGPGGAYLIVLMHESEAVFEAVLAAAGRRDAIVVARMLAAHGTMVEAMAMAKREGSGPADAGSAGAGLHGGRTGTRLDDRKNDRVNDPINDRINEPANAPPDDRLNPRQRWYLGALAAGKEVRAGDLQHRWGVSETTARRDLATLKERGMIEFVGPPRTGRYRLRR
jgi:DeoR-like helix-turn-helix domain